MEKYSKAFLKQAHEASIYHEAKIRASKTSGCFHCQKIFSQEEIIDWTDENSGKGKTAICPKCGIDAVLPDDYPIEDKLFLEKMNKVWF